MSSFSALEPPPDAELVTPLFYDSVRDCYRAIQQKDTVLFNKNIDILFAAFRESYPHERPYSDNQQNLYCTLLQLARKASDSYWLDSSNSILDRLSLATQKAQTPKVFLTIERAFNNLRRVSAKQAKGFKAKPSPSIDLNELDWKLFRRVSTAYYLAHEFSRAKFCVESALKIENQSSSANAMDREQLLLLLNAACISVVTKDFEKADAYLDQFMLSPSYERGNCIPTFLELVSVYSNSGRNQQAEAMLKAIRQLAPALRACRDGYQTSLIANDFSTVDYVLAKLLSKSGRSKEAQSLIESVIAKLDSKRLPKCGAQIYLLAASLAEADKDYGRAAKHYLEASKVNHPNRDFEQDCLEKALLVANKDQSFDCELRAKIILLHIDKIKDPKEALAQLLRCDRKTFEDPQVAIKLRNLLGRINCDKEALAYYEQTISLLPDSSSVKNTVQLNALEIKERLSLISKPLFLEQKIQLLEKAAALSEQAHSKDVVFRWAYLAQSETEAGMNSRALSHLIRAVSHISASTWRGWDIGIGTVYSAFGLEDAVGADKFIDSLDNIVTQNSGVLEALDFRALVLKYQVEHRDAVRSIREMRSILLRANSASESKPSDFLMFYRSHCWCSGHCSAGEIVSNVRRIAYDAACDQKKATLGLKVLQEFLAVQKSQLPPDDERLAETYKYLGEAHYKACDYKASAASYQKYIEVSKPFNRTEKEAFARIDRTYTAALRCLGNDNEIARLQALKFEFPERSKGSVQEVR